MVNDYRARHRGWNVRHYHARYRAVGGTRSYNWVRLHLQKAGEVPPRRRRAGHRLRREPAPLPGMMLHQDASSHEWVAGRTWDLVVTMDDATNECCSMFLVGEEGTASSFRGVREVVASKGVFCSLYTDRASHYWFTPEAGGKVDKGRPTQFGRAMSQLGVEMIPAYSPEARGRSERMFGTLQGRLPQELALAGVADMAEANAFLASDFLPRHNAEFMRPAREQGSAYAPVLSMGVVDDILCEHHSRMVGRDNCVQFDGLALQVAPDPGRPVVRGGQGDGAPTPERLHQRRAWPHDLGRVRPQRGTRQRKRLRWRGPIGPRQRTMKHDISFVKKDDISKCC